MATYTGKNTYGANDANGLEGGVAGNLKCSPVTFSLTAALAAGDVIVGPLVPAGATLIDVILDATDLDTGGSPAITLNVGTAASASAFIAASNVGQAGGRARAAVVGALPVTMTADTRIQAVVGTAPATGATTGSVTITALFVSRKG